MAIYRVLLVEDFCTLRRTISLMLQRHPDYLVVGEASDGQEAIQMAAELQPDLVLLDINLPTLSGLEVAPQIQRLSSCKVIFLTQEPAAEVVEEALRAGAHGYVLKVDAGSELLAAVEAVRGGERYVSRRLRARLATELLVAAPLTSESTGNDGAGMREFHGEESRTRHEAEYYWDDDDFLESLERCVLRALRGPDAVIVFATELHGAALRRRLCAAGLNVRAELESGRLRMVDADEAISDFLDDELPDENRWREDARQLIQSAANAVNEKCQRVHIFGECLSLLYAKGRGDVVLWLERMWDDLGKTHQLYLRCWYRVSPQQRERDSAFFQNIRAAHSAVHSA